MSSTIRNRLIVVLGLVILSIVALIPREVTIRERGADGRMRDTAITRVPLKLGLDLRGGMHLALELDESGGPVANPEDAIDRALTVIRTRVDEFGVAEPLIQKVGDDRIVVELAGVDDPGRARAIVERSAFLEWRITDMDNQFADALETIDLALVRAGVRSSGSGGGTASLEALLGRSESAAERAPLCGTAPRRVSRPGGAVHSG
jgi:preprotein translocase subunit SecD